MRGAAAGTAARAAGQGQRQGPAVTEVSPTQEWDEEAGIGRLERLNWPGLAMAAVIGLLTIGLVVITFGFQGPGLLDRLLGGPNPPATPGEVSQVTGTPTGLPLVVITPTVASTASPTLTPPAAATATATTLPTSVPTATDTPAPPTLTPLPPTETPLPAPTATPTVTPLPTETATRSPRRQPALTPPSWRACHRSIQACRAICCSRTFRPWSRSVVPTGRRAPAWRSRGNSSAVAIVAFSTTQEMLAVYSDAQQWERQFVPDGEAVTLEETPPEGLYLPNGRFAWLWAQGDRRSELGFAKTQLPGDFPFVYQTFPGALLLLNQSSGQVVVLPTANQR